ncbi:hypothetical protein CR194_05285 [Salipaludibacillus keqinensis]|uniref:Uncharacterized protein n=1 Tax=Salipaludibacillus keqinensis TaxID=2045207 RepID=A0A323TLT7_9BACI|nr:hypothetical protein [Salipaludibacillus keqinensis]PYZ94934.1 hypothetical protein CR194_05285 [Salipaludibacillus keqinensis]
MGKRKKPPIKIGPDKGLAEQEIFNLNKEFYNDYAKDYFGTKLVLLSSILSNPDKFIDVLHDGEDVKVGVLSYKLDEDDLTKNELEKFARLELATTYYHCLETFLRLFLAHVSIPACPWLEISRDTDFRKFKKTVSDLLEDNFKYDDTQFTVVENLLYVFYGNYQEETFSQQGISREEAKGILMKWIKWAAKDFISVYDYNAFKHGLTVSTDTQGLTIGRVDETFKLEERGDALKFIAKKQKTERWVWEKKYVFTPLDFRAVAINIYSGLINNLLKVGRVTYLKEEQLDKMLFLGGKDAVPEHFHQMVKTENELGISLQGYSMELLYYRLDK